MSVIGAMEMVSDSNKYGSCHGFENESISIFSD